MKKLWIIVLLFSLGIFAQAQDSSPSETESAWPSQFYAPYVYMAAYPRFQLFQIAEEHNVRFFSLGFVLASTECDAKWSGIVAVDGSISHIYRILQNDLSRLRALGGDVIVSFGGAGGDELAQACLDVESLAAQYQRVIDAYGVRYLDFDIEGDDIYEPETIDRRSESIALLEANNEQDLIISFTLPVLPTGLTPEGMYVLESAIEHGVEIDVVNIMTMNFGENFVDKSMGENNILAAQSLFAQLQSLYPDKDEAALWSMIGLTPMAGMNDRLSDIFYLEDAELVTNFVMEKGIRMISLWAVDRDVACEFIDAVANNCSGIEQDPFAFSAIFNRITPALEEAQ